jgi:5-methylthioadenosine/S-adenosylhomocysteine deaminase
MPGLVNVHCHSAMTLFRGAAEDVPLDRFLREILWPREGRLTRDDVYWGMALAAVELLRFGVTTTCEMYIFEDGMLAAVEESGMRSLITPGVIEVPGWTPWKARLDEVLAFHAKHAGKNDRIEIGIAAHAAYTLPLEALVEIAAAARERDMLIHIHVAETQEESRELERQHNKTVPALLADIGFFEPRVLAAHSVWLTDDDLTIYRERGVSVGHCPQSNAKLSAGIARLSDMLRLGIHVGLGTDGPASNNDLDLWEEIRLSSLLARLRTGDPSAVSARQALMLATRGGGEALGRPDLGVLAKNSWADMILLRMDDPAFVPLNDEADLISHLVWSASSRLITDVWVGGQRVVRDRRCLTIDEERARAEVQQRALRLASG